MTSISLAPTAAPSQGGLAHARAIVRKWLGPVDLEVVDLVLATIRANSEAGEAIALILIGGPSSAKTELLRCTFSLPQVHWISSLTPQTFLSGYLKQDGGRDKAQDKHLLKRLEGVSTLVIKDLASLRDLRPEARREVLAQVREIMDGLLAKEFGTGERAEWVGKLGLLCASTPDIEVDLAVFRRMGDRFLLCRMGGGGSNGRIEKGRRALDDQGREEEMRGEIRAAFREALEGAREATLAQRDDILAIADALAVARTPVARDENGGVLYLPETEEPPRLAKALANLGVALAGLRGREELGPEEVATLRRVARDTIPGVRRRILEFLASSPGSAEKGIKDALKTSCHRPLEDLRLLEAVTATREEAQRERGQPQFLYSLNPKFEILFRKIQ